jgi:hypothetical protein
MSLAQDFVDSGEEAKPPRQWRPGGWNVGLSAEVANGASSDFQNRLLGARLVHRFSDRISYGGYLALVNLKGKEGRVANALPAAVLEYRIPFGPKRRWGLPLRISSGYLPKNGPYVRFGPALGIPIGSFTDLIIDAFVPALWLTQDRPEISLNASAELLFRM